MKFILCTLALIPSLAIAVNPFDIRVRMVDPTGNFEQVFNVAYPTSGSGVIWYDSASSPKQPSISTLSASFTASGGTFDLSTAFWNQIDADIAAGSPTWANITDKPSLFSGAYVDLTGKPTLFSGAYADLTGKPTIPTVDSASIIAGLGFTPYNATNPNAYVNQAGARSAISLTTTGSGAATYNSSTGALNIPPGNSGTVTSVTAGTGLSGGTITTTGTISLPNTGTAGTFTTVTTDEQGRVASGTALLIATGTTRSIVTTTSSTGFQIDASRDCEVSYDIDMLSTATIGGASSVTVYLETADTNSTTPGDWTTVAKVSNGQTITLAIVLQSAQTATMQVTRKVPAGKWVRLRSVIAGTASATIAHQQENKF